MAYQKFGEGYDWRGVPLAVGQTVIYGAPVGRSIAMVEAEVLELYTAKGYTKEPKVKLKVKYRAYGGSYKEVVSVGQDRVTVVEKLPPSGLTQTVSEEIEERDRKDRERKAFGATHTLKPQPEYPRSSSPSLNSAVVRANYAAYQQECDDWKASACAVCGCSYFQTWQQACTAP